MFRIRAKTKDGRSFAGPSGAQDFAGALAETEKVAKAAGKTLVLVAIKVTEGVGPGIRLTTPRKAGKK